MSDFLFELGCEELPSALVLPLAEALAAAVQQSLSKADLPVGSCKIYATPRRLAFVLQGLSDEQPSQKILKRGPALAAAYDSKGEPTQALLGFAKSLGVELSELKPQKTEKGEWLCYEAVRTGAKTLSLLPLFLADALSKLPIPKPMRWGASEIEFARPVHWILALWNDELVDCSLLGTQAGRLSYGHRFLAPGPIAVTIKDYEALLEKAYVIADFAKRRQRIVEQIEAAATKAKAKALMPKALVDEVTSIVEWPVALSASFAKDFLQIPAEALIASMQQHQKCFALTDENQQLKPAFITVANIPAKNINQVIAGNEKVMQARLSDAAFFFNQDKKQPLASYFPATATVIFQVKLGSLQEKAERLGHLMAYLAKELQLDKTKAARAAFLAKCDLMTGMVGEFPELEGLMGFYYALHDGEDEEVAKALPEQYQPRFAADYLPASALGRALSIADRLDTLVGIFALGQKPSGEKDPFKLRRHALALVRLLLAAKNQLSLTALIEQALAVYQSKGLPVSASQLIFEVKAFILERLQSYYQGLAIEADLVQAVRQQGEDRLYDFDRRIAALQGFRQLPEALSLAAALKRVNNILSKNEASLDERSEFNEGLVEQGAELALLDAIKAVETAIAKLYPAEDYYASLESLASLALPIDAFFTGVMVMVEDEQLKINRLHLLKRLQRLLSSVADLSSLQFS